MPKHPSDIPDWLTQAEDYRPGHDRDGFITQSLLSISSVLARFRLDDGSKTALSPSAPVKIVVGLVSILLTSLARNYLFVAVMAASLLARAAFLPRAALARVVSGAGTAAAVCLLVMLPALLIGQPRAALGLATKTFVCTGITLTVALTTPVGELTGAFRRFGVPGIVIMTIDLALRSIVRLGETASEALCALKLRSVGRNRHKQRSLGGIGGIVLLKASRAAQDTYDAMRCRGFDGTYQGGSREQRAPADPVWLVALVGLCGLFFYLQGAI